MPDHAAPCHRRSLRGRVHGRGPQVRERPGGGSPTRDAVGTQSEDTKSAPGTGAPPPVVTPAACYHGCVDAYACLASAVLPPLTRPVADGDHISAKQQDLGRSRRWEEPATILDYVVDEQRRVHEAIEKTEDDRDEHHTVCVLRRQFWPSRAFCPRGLSERLTPPRPFVGHGAAGRQGGRRQDESGERSRSSCDAGGGKRISCPSGPASATPTRDRSPLQGAAFRGRTGGRRRSRVGLLTITSPTTMRAVTE